nr:ribonuclease H-like domain-containing protein [Tanacetum cinerariifolium]
MQGYELTLTVQGNLIDGKKDCWTSEETYEPTLAEEKLDKRNEIKARGTLLMTLPNKDQLKFHSYQDEKLIMKAIEKRYGGNKESKKSVRNSRRGHSTRGHALKTVESLPFEWKTHALIWRNKAELETISLNDLFNNLKIYEPELSGSSNTNQNLQNIAFVSLNITSSTNEADTTTSEVSTAHTPEDLEQIDPDDLEEMDLHWEMAMLTIRARRFMKRTGKNLDMNGRRIGFDKSKVECFNYHKNGHFVRECKAQKNQDNIGREYERKPVLVETPTENALIAQDRNGGYDWSYQFEEEIPTNYTFMALTSSESSSSSESEGNPQQKEYKEKGVIDSGCSRHMTGNKCYLTDFEIYDGGFVSFRDGKSRISGKGKIKTGKLDFDDVYFCKEHKYNMFSVSQMCDKKNNVPFTDTKCLVLSSNFKLFDESQVLLRVLRKDNIYSVDLKSVVPTGGLTCLFAKATLDESNLWHRRLGHINFKTMNKLVKGNLIREAVNTAWYILNRALVTKPHNKTPYELTRRRPPLIDFIKPFGCVVTILNTRDNLGKFKGKADEGYFVRKKAPKVDENEALDNGGKNDQVPRSEVESLIQQERQPENINSTISFNTVSSPVNTVGSSFVNVASQTPINAAGPSTNVTRIFGNAYDDDVLEEQVDINNVDSSYTFPDATKFLKDHPQEQVIGSLETPIQTRQMSKTHEEF